MADYLVHFNIHLIPFLKPEGWGNPVPHEAFFRVDNFLDLKEKVNAYLWTFVKQQGVVVLRESPKPLQDDIGTMDLCQYVPMHMIAYISHSTKKLVSDIPNEEEEGRLLQ